MFVCCSGRKCWAEISVLFLFVLLFYSFFDTPKLFVKNKTKTNK